MSWQNPFWLVALFIVALLGIKEHRAKNNVEMELRLEQARHDECAQCLMDRSNELFEREQDIERYKVMSKFWMEEAERRGYKAIGSP